MNGTTPGPDFYADFSRFSKLRSIARNNSDQGIRHVAEQFESIFMQMMLKSMRQASLGGGLLDNNQSDFYREMHDKQLSLHLAKKTNLGIANLLTKQLGSSEPTQSAVNGHGLEAYRSFPIQGLSRLEEKSGKLLGDLSESIDIKRTGLKIKNDKPITTQQDFIQRFTPYARQVAADLGVDPKLLLAQAALETGWGSAVIRHQDGSSSHNLFGIKADNRWSGERVDVTTLEYYNGIPEKHRAHFRSYPDFKASFEDFARFLKENPRYEMALGNANDAFKFVKALQDAGYATDPNYANKVMNIYARDELANV